MHTVWRKNSCDASTSNAFSATNNYAATSVYRIPTASGATPFICSTTTTSTTSTTSSAIIYVFNTTRLQVVLFGRGQHCWSGFTG